MTVPWITWRTTRGDRVEVYPSAIGTSRFGWRYRIRARNGQVVEMGSEGYTRRRNAVRAALRHHPQVES